MEGRKRLYHWLKKNVEEEKYGLKWVNREEQLFSIPWVHKHSRSWNTDYCQIFKEWAKFTNRYKQGDSENWPGWKTRLRAALTKLPYFEEMHDMHRLENVDRPYKVYKFVSKSNVKDFSHFSPNKTVSPSSVSNTNMKDFADSSPSTTVSPSSSQSTDNSPGAPSPPHYFDALSPTFDKALFSKGCNPFLWEESQENALALHNGIVGEQLDEMNIPIQSQTLDENVQRCQTVEGQSGTDFFYGLSPDLENCNDLVMNSRLHSDELRKYKDEPQKPVMFYKIYYLNELVKEGYIYDIGALFHFGQIIDLPSPYSENLYGRKTLERIEFPDITNIHRGINLEQQQLIQSVLMKMDRGFILECDFENNILAQRLCRTRLFAQSSWLGNTSLLLDRRSKQKVKLFDLAEYKTNPQNCPSVSLTFAQDFKPNELIKNVLVRMELIHIEGMLFQQKSAPSEEKKSLQFSTLDSSDELLCQLESMKLWDDRRSNIN